MKKFLKPFTKKYWEKQMKKSLELKMQLKENAINYISNGKATIILLTVGLVKKA